MNLRKPWFAAICFAVTTAAQASGTAEVLVGSRNLSSDLDPVDSQVVIGVQAAWGPDTWPVRVAAGLFSSSDSQGGPLGSIKADVFELSAGVRWYAFERNQWNVYVGGGFSLVRGEFDLVTTSDSGSTVGGYINGGGAWRFGSRFSVGADVRFLGLAELDVLETQRRVNYGQIAVLFGVGWPARK